MIASQHLSLGSRMMSTCLRGCTINLLEKTSEINEILERIAFGYHQQKGHQMEVYHLKLSEGIKLLNSEEAEKVQLLKCLIQSSTK